MRLVAAWSSGLPIELLGGKSTVQISLSPEMFFLMLVLLAEYIFLTNFYGLYFNHQYTLQLQFHQVINVCVNQYIRESVASDKFEDFFLNSRILLCEV